MDISMNELDNITLAYFANKKQYEGIRKRTELYNDGNFNAEKKFYKKRILDLTKRMFRGETEELHIKPNFNNYLKVCISYLKSKDRNDIIQEKYEDGTDVIIGTNIISEPTANETDISETDISENDKSIKIDNLDCTPNDYLFRKPINNNNIKKYTLDTFIIKKEIPDDQNSRDDKTFPKKENVNIKTKGHKTKGIKKKNLNNIYEDSSEKK